MSALIDKRLGELLAAIDDAETAVESAPTEAARHTAIMLGIANIVLAKGEYDKARLADDLPNEIPVLGAVH